MTLHSFNSSRGITMVAVKFFHVLFVFIWIGSLMTLSRFLGYHVKESVDTQMRLARIYRRIYLFVQMPCMILAVTLGMILWANLDLSYKPGWFHMKLTCAFGLIICDILTGKYVIRLNRDPDLGRGVKYKILHGMTGLLLIFLLLSSIVIRDKPGEIINRYKKSQESSKRR